MQRFVFVKRAENDMKTPERCRNPDDSWRWWRQKDRISGRHTTCACGRRDDDGVDENEMDVGSRYLQKEAR